MENYFAQHKNLSKAEIEWLEKLNRLDMGYLSVFVEELIRKQDLTANERIRALQAMERYLFVVFKLGNTEKSYGSEEFHEITQRFLEGRMDIEEVIDFTEEITNREVEKALSNFTAEMEKKFIEGKGFYHWDSILYFLYEYEISLESEENENYRSSWDLLSVSKQNKTSIDYILPQDAGSCYWQEYFIQLEEKEMERIAEALGNLLLLSESIDPNLQRVDFPNKKRGTDRRRGYRYGSNSEREVSLYKDWTAQNILSRSRKLLEFMEKRWNIKFNEKQLQTLIYVGMKK